MKRCNCIRRIGLNDQCFAGKHTDEELNGTSQRRIEKDLVMSHPGRAGTGMIVELAFGTSVVR